MPLTMLTPLEFGAARQSGATLWRKQLLPVGEIDYKGRKIAFSREYLAGLVRAFRDRAYDQVPFQLADAANTHTNDPERFRGEVRDLELTDDGLDVIVAASDDGARVLAANPRLGVSARIIEDYARSDGQHFAAAIQHVLGTLDPRIPGMRPWQAVEAANDDSGDVLDLTVAADPPGKPESPAAPPEQQPPASPPKENVMALTEAQEGRLAKLLDLPDDKLDALIAAATADPGDGAGGGDGDPDAGGEQELSDAELEALLAEIEAEGTGDAAEGTGGAEPEPALAGAQLSAEAQAAIEMANARAEETSLELARVTQKLAAEAYKAERDTLARQYGIPPRITDLARPLLEGEGRTVELSNGKNADAGAIVRKVLEEVGKTVRMLDLSAELGTPLDGGEEAAKARAADEERERGELVSAVRKMAGL